MATTTSVATATSVLDGWKAQGIRFVRFELPDMHGTSRTKMVPIERAYGYAESGLNMYGGVAVLDSRSDVVGGTLYNEEIAYGDQLLIPDPSTAAVVPWADATARWICDSQWADGTPLEALPRRVYRRQLERANALGYDALIGMEPEFYVLDSDHQQLFHGYQIFNLTRNTYVPFIQELVEQLNAYDIEVMTANCEYAGSQWELPFMPARGMGGPDRCFSFKNAVKELAHHHGYVATFMSKPYADSAGSGLHSHISLLNLEDGSNAFGDDSAKHGISDVCQQFLAGQLAHAASVYALLAPTVNCLKRRRPHTFSPSNISWGTEDRTALVRIKGGSESSRHIEHRAPTGLANPYLIGAALLAAGLSGIEQGLELEPPAAGPAEEDPSKHPLPLSVRESLEAMESDPVIREALGEEFVTAYGAMRRHELQRFDDHVTDWEREEYVEVFSRTVSLFITCFNDTLFPDTGRAMVDLLERLGCSVEFREEQTCCGQMHLNSGYRDEGLALVERFRGVFAGAEAIVAPSASCAGHVRATAPELPVYELTEYLTDVLGVEDVGARFPHRVCYHPTCHSLRELGLGDRPQRLLDSVGEIDVVPLDDADQCCGFGGTFAVKNADVSTAMMDDKLDRIERSGAEVVTSADNSCLMHLGGGLRRRGSAVRTMHLAEILAAT